MSTRPSEQMMDLLKELALLKELDGRHETGSSVDTTELECRKSRRQEICKQIKALGGPIG